MAKKAAKPLFRVGLLGESPNDTKAVARLLSLRYAGRVEFITLIKGVTGDNLETAGAFNLLRREYDYERPNLVVVIRDLDGLENNRAQQQKRNSYFRRVHRRVEGKSLPLLNIYTIEALIAAHIENFNAHYGCQCVIAGDVMQLEKPIDLLRAATKTCKVQYQEAHCAELLGKSSYELLLAHCRYFKEFDAKFRARLPALA